MFRNITSDLRRNLIKIFCLTIGLALGMLLTAKVFLEQTYDTCYKDADRIYTVYTTVQNDGETRDYSGTPGAIAPGLKRYVPQVEAATRYTSVSGPIDVKITDGRLIGSDGIILADSSLFDVFSTEIIAGDPHEILTVENRCMIPRSLAEKIGCDVVGMPLTSPQLGNEYEVIVGGVYDDYPINSSMNNAIYLSMPSIKNFMYDGSQNWMGNDRYKSRVLLAKGSTVEETRPYIDRMLKDNLPEEALSVFHLNFQLSPLEGSHTSQGTAKTMMWVLGILAVIILLSASLNYLLIVIGQMGQRGKEFAVRKCYGTGNGKIFASILGESAFMLAISTALAVLVVLCLSDECQRLLGFTSEELLGTGKVWLVELGVCLALLIVTGVIPAWMYCATPVARAFHRSSNSRRFWKLALLAVQFFASGLLFCLLTVVFRQFNMMSNGEMGYEYENIGTAYVNLLSQDKRVALVNELKSLACVDDVASAEQDFTAMASGNNVWIEGDPKKDNEVNVADMYYANSNLFDVMGMEFVQGEPFSPTSDSTVHQVIVEERFIDVMKKHFGATDDNIIGKKFNITEHIAMDGYDQYTICGVIKNIRRGGYSTNSADTRAGVLFPSSRIRWILYIRFHQLTPETIEEAQAVVDKFAGEYDIYVMPLRTFVDALNEPVKRFATSVIIAGLAILIITLIGLVGYTSDEVQRRAKEIAIRKVNGTTVRQIIELLCLDIVKVAVPSLIAGAICAAIIGSYWLSQFTEQVSISPVSMILAILALLIIIIAVVTLNSLKVARSNPVKYLRNE